MLAGLLALVLAAPLKVAVMPVASGEGVPGKTAEAISGAVTAEVRKRSGGQVITQQEVNTLLSLEQQKAMLGCQNDSCFAEIGGALGVERVVSGDLSRLGESWLFHLKLLDPGKAQVLASSDRRLRGGTIDDVLDALPAMVGELFPPAPRPAAPSAGTTPQTAPAASVGTPAKAAPQASAGAAPAPQASAEAPPITPATLEVAPAVAPDHPAGQGTEPLPPPTAPMPGRTPARPVLSAFLERSIPVPLRARADLQVFTDEAGHFLAVAPFGEEKSPVFFGTRRKLYSQQVLERREQDTAGSGVAVWDPRVPGGRALVAVSGEGAVIRCGDRDVTLSALPKKQRDALLEAATFYAPPFARQPVALARDGEGNFFFVDTARDTRAHGQDYRLYAGPSGALARQEIQQISNEGSGTVIRTARGRLRFKEGEGGKQADWLAEGGRRMLIWMDPAENKQLVFGELGVYGAQPLWTPCDTAQR
jgi:hypothetical protein